MDLRWIETSSGTGTDRFQYGYDRNSNRLWRDNLVNTAFGELYAYDGLNQLTSMQRGTLNGTKTGLTGSASRSQSWDFDAVGNWDAVTTDGSTQTRSHNKQNEITSISGATTPTYDASGNMTRDEAGRTFEYDAWNRLVRAKNSGGSTIAEYKYDALSRRVSETKSGTTTDLYYSSAWQVLEERVGGSPRVQYTWSPVYVDALVLRDRDADANSSLEERLWVQQDANFNVTALLDNSGNVVERYAYDAFGNFAVYDSAYVLQSGGSGYGWVYQHQGLRYDATITGYDNAGRWYDPDLGRFVQNDLIGFFAGDENLYRYVANNPTNRIDSTGLADKPALVSPPHEQELARIIEEVIAELKMEGWEPPKTSTGRADHGAFGKELEKRVFARVEELPHDVIRGRLGVKKTKCKLWYTNITVEKATGLIVEMGHTGGVVDTNKHVQLDIVFLKPGSKYVPQVGEVLDVDRIMDIYDLKANRDGLIDAKQAAGVNQLLALGKSPPKPKILHTPERFVPGKGIVPNPRYSRAVKFFSAMEGAACVGAVAWGIIHYRDYEDQLDNAIYQYELAESVRDDPVQLKVQAYIAHGALMKYLENFGHNPNLVDLGIIYRMLGK